MDDDIGDEVYMPTNSIAIPIIVNILIIAGYVGVGAVCFGQWEGWSTMAAAYFSFVTLTTIGFGDLVPIKSFTGIGKDDAGAFEWIQMIFSTIYCGIGRSPKTNDYKSKCHATHVSLRYKTLFSLNLFCRVGPCVNVYITNPRASSTAGSSSGWH